MHDLPHPGRPVEKRDVKTISRVFDYISENPKSSVRYIGESLQLSKTTVHRILVDELLFRKVCSVWVPHHLTIENKLKRVDCAKSLLQLHNDYSMYELLRLFAVQDETWIPFDLLPSKAENKVWIPPEASRPTVVRPELTFNKTMLSIVFTGNGKVHANVTQKGGTIDSERYVQFVHETGELWRKLRRDPTKLRELLWMHDNARPHSAGNTKQFFDQRGIQLVEQSPYSPDFNMCDRWLFKELKKGLRGRHFNRAEEILHASLEIFHSIPPDRFEKELENLVDHCHSGIYKHGARLLAILFP